MNRAVGKRQATFTKTSQYFVTIDTLWLTHHNKHNEVIADTHHTIMLVDWLYHIDTLYVMDSN